jgi:phospholipid/cholesterol/gamma-HCH transport system substrate-binding protein
MMAENKARFAFVALLLGGTVVALAWYFAAEGRYTTYQIDTDDPVSGLIADAPVEFHGVDVGKVQRVELIGPRSVRVLLSVRKDAPMTMGTVATITGRGLATRGFTGYVYVALEDSGSDTREVAVGPGSPIPVIHTAPSRSVNLDTTISEVNANVQVMTALLQSVLDERTIVSLKQSVDSLERVTATLAANDKKMSTIISNTERASHRFKPLLEASQDTVRSLQTQVLPEAYRAVADLDRLSGSLNAVATKVNRDPAILLRGNAVKQQGPGEGR